jgi:hypothetical protein
MEELRFDNGRVIRKKRCSELYLLEKPPAQRDLIEENAQKICENFDSRAVQMLTVACIGSKEYLLDGQHRLAAMKRIYEEDNSIDHEIAVEYITLSNMKEIDKYYQKLNERTLAPKVKCSIEETRTIYKLFEENFPNYIKTTETKIPYLNKNKLIEELDKRFDSTDDVELLWEVILELNEYYEKNIKKILREKRKDLQNPEKIVTAIKQNRTHFYLGVIKKFKWLDEVKERYLQLR